MKKLILFAAILGMSFGLSSFTAPSRVFAGTETRKEVSNYVFLHVYSHDRKETYISNIIRIEGSSVSDYSDKLRAVKERFRKILKNYYDLDWTAPITASEDEDRDSLSDTRKNKIKYAGDDWKSIEL
ncbi:MAG: hypothetical protein H7320_03175 [Ferruginibacter sp.]|nr:hypothetical protein [Ferruginibacter sp.]